MAANASFAVKPGLKAALKSATETFRRVDANEDEYFCGSLLHPTLKGHVFYWECRPLLDVIRGLEIEGHVVLARDLAATKLVEEERPAKLKAAKIYRENIGRLRWCIFQRFGQIDGRPKVSCDDSSSFYTDPSPVRYLACLDDLVLNDRLVYKGSRKPTRKPTRRPRHGRPPDSRQPESHASNQHDTSVTSSPVSVPSELETTHVSYARVPFIFSSPSAAQFLSLDPSRSTAHNENPHFVPDLSRNAEFRAVLSTDEQQMTATAQPSVNICNPLRSSQHGGFFFPDA